jgi:antitoxin FitA
MISLYMAQLVVRNLENSVKERLRQRARRHRRSMEEEAREILRASVRQDEAASAGLGSEISALFKKSGLVSDIPELRGHTLQAPRFEE